METVSVLQGDLKTLHLTSFNHTPSLEGSLSDNTGFQVWDLDDSVVPPYSHVTSPHGTHSSPVSWGTAMPKVVGRIRLEMCKLSDVLPRMWGYSINGNCFVIMVVRQVL